MQWAEPSKEYTEKFYREFVRTPVVLDSSKEIDKNAEYSDPKEVFPDSYVEYTKTFYGEDKDLHKGKLNKTKGKVCLHHMSEVVCVFFSIPNYNKHFMCDIFFL